MAKPTNFDELYPGRFLKAGLLKGMKPTLTISNIELEELEDDKQKKKAKGIVSFKERPLQLVLNKTNGLCLKAMFGKELSNWYGKRIVLFAGEWNGEECIRVWGSPDIAKDMTIQVELPRRKPFPMVMHAAKNGPAPKTASGKRAAGEVDPRITTAWELLGWKESEGAEDYAQWEGDEAGYVAHLNALIDQRDAVEA
jgi:hypothetical protein